MYVSGRIDIFDKVDVDLFTVVALNMMVLKLGYTGKSEPMFYNYLKPLTSLDEGLYALDCEEDVRCLGTLVRSFKLIEVYIEHGVTALDSYLKAPRFRATLEEITNEAGSIATNINEKMLLLTWHESSETTKEPVCESVTPRSLPQHDSSTSCKDFVYESITPRCMPDCILTPPTDESVITYTRLSGVQGVDTQNDVMRQLSFDETELDGEAGFVDVAGGGVDSSGLSHDESFGVDDMDLNLNEHVNVNVSQVETQSKLPVSKEPDVGRTQEPILSEVSTQEPIMAEVSNEVPIVEEVGTQEFSLEDVVVEDYVSSGEDREDAKQDIAYETEYDVRYSEDAGTDDNDDVDDDFLVDEENEILEPDVDVHLLGISMDLPFDNIGITNLVPDDVLEGEDVDVINADGFDSDPGNDEEKNYRKRRLAELRTEMEGVINASGQWKYSFYTGQKFTTPKEAKDRVYLHSIESTGPTGPNRGMEDGPSGSSGPTTRSKKRKNTVKAVQDQLQRELEVQISMSKAFRAKAKAEREIRGDHVLQYSMLKDYVVELQSTNPNTTVKIAVERNIDPSLPTRVFQRIYICLGALKLGFRACRRDLLGLDGAFMKGPFPGQVLVAVGLDSNNGIYPLAYALVEAKSKSSWCWFLQCLGDDIDLHPNSNFTFISDRQKGIIPAIKTVYPTASVTNVRDFEKCMLELKTMNPKAHEWLNKIPAEHWARSYFLGRAKSDLLLNNICEVFNGKIVGGRDKPVITLLEYIREYCMKRIVNVQGVIDKCTGPLTPTPTRIMESIKKEDHLMKVQWNGANKYQVLGIPCKHAVAACWNMALNDRAAQPPETWEKSTCPTTLLPPKHHIQVGRPRKKRKRSKHENEPFVKDGKLIRKGRTITCQSCGNTGHNKATCKGQGRKATTGGNNAQASSSAYGQAQQTEPAVGQDGLGGSGAGAVIGLSAAAG
ncbi:heat stress transcription factor B-4-like protein [Tanacetum coccineum]